MRISTRAPETGPSRRTRTHWTTGRGWCRRARRRGRCAVCVVSGGVDARAVLEDLDLARALELGHERLGGGDAGRLGVAGGGLRQHRLRVAAGLGLGELEDVGALGAGRAQRAGEHRGDARKKKTPRRRSGSSSAARGGDAIRSGGSRRPRARGSAARRPPGGRAARPAGGRARRRARGSRQAALGVIGQRVDADESCWAQAIPIGGRPSASGRALQTAVTTICFSGENSAVGSSRCAGRRRLRLIRRSTRMWSWARSSSGSRQMSGTVSAPTSASRSAPACSANRCSASSRSSAAARSRSSGTRINSSLPTASPAPRPPWAT